MNFEKMNLLELGEFWKKDWESESPKLENPNTMRMWDNAVEFKKRTASELELLQFLHVVKDEEYIETVSNVRHHFFLVICESLQEQVEIIEKSVQMLLKEHEHEPAKITVGQLNRLKGGI